MTKEERLELLKQIEKDIHVCSIESTFLDDAKSCAIHSVIEELEQEPTTKNDLGVENDLVSSIIEKISEKVTETREEFIFETIRPYCENVVQMKISKRDLEQALLKYYGKNDLGVDCVARQDVERYIEGFINEYTPKKELEFINLELDGLKHLPSVTSQEPVLDKIRAEIAEYGSIMVAYAITDDTKTDKGIEKLVSDVLKEAKEEVLGIIDKYKAERTDNAEV